jgi:hypothetical protein
VNERLYNYLGGGDKEERIVKEKREKNTKGIESRKRRGQIAIKVEREHFFYCTCKSICSLIPFVKIANVKEG